MLYREDDTNLRDFKETCTTKTKTFLNLLCSPIKENDVVYMFFYMFAPPFHTMFSLKQAQLLRAGTIVGTGLGGRVGGGVGLNTGKLEGDGVEEGGGVGGIEGIAEGSGEGASEGYKISSHATVSSKPPSSPALAL
jgi:hypothetical protein